MVKSQQREAVRGQLLEQGFNRELVEEALEKTSSVDLEILLEYIDDKMIHNKDNSINEPSNISTSSKGEKERKKKMDELAKQKQARKQEQLHLRKLRDQIKADRMELEQEKLKEQSKNPVKTVEVKETVGPDDCSITVMNLENGENLLIVSKKGEEISILLKRIEELVAIADIEVFNGEDLVEDDRKSLEEHGFFPFVTLMVKCAE